MAVPINPTPAAKTAITAPEGAPRPGSGLPPPRARRRAEEDRVEEARVLAALREQGPGPNIEDNPLDLLQQQALAAELPPVSQAQVVRLYEHLQHEPGFARLAAGILEALDNGDAAPSAAFVTGCIEEILAGRPEMPRTTLVVASGPRGEPPPMDVRKLETNVVGMALAALLAAHIAGNADKRATFRRTEMFQAIMQALNNYVTNVLMSAQKRMSATLARRKGRDHAQTSVVIDGVASDLNVDFAPYNDDEERYEPQFKFDDEHGGSRQMTQQDLQYAIDQAGQWRQTLTNNQSRQVNEFQGIDSSQTSQMNIITSLMKNIKDSVDSVTRNLAN